MLLADEICVGSSYAVHNEQDVSYINIGDRKININKWNIGNSDDGVFIGISLKDGRLIESLSLNHEEARKFIGNPLHYGSDDTHLESCKKL